MDPQSRPAEFSSAGRRWREVGDLLWTLLALAVDQPCALSAGRAPRPVLVRSEGGWQGRWLLRQALL